MIDRIMDVWGGYDDFREGGLDYVCWVQRQNLHEMRMARNDDDAANELADQAIVAIRQLAEMGYDPEEVITDRLDDRMDGKQEEIIEAYQTQYDL